MSKRLRPARRLLSPPSKFDSRTARVFSPATLLLPWLLIAALFFQAGCNSRSSDADLVFVNGAEPQTLDPAHINGQLEGRLAYALFEGLTRRNAQGEVEPGIASSWDISADALTYTFHLRPEARWSNGDPVTAQDFYDSWKRVLEPSTASVYAEILFFIKNAEAYQSGKEKDFKQVGIRVLGSHKLQVQLNSPAPFFPEVISFVTYLPVPRSTVERHGSAWIKPAHMVNNGPFRLLAWKINDRVQLQRNESYWDQARVRLNRIDALSTSQGNTAVNLYLTGQADLLLDKGLIPPQILGELSQRPDFHRFTFLGTYFYRFNTTRAPLNNPLVRKALSAAIDRQRIVENCTRGGEPVARSFTPPGIPGYTPPQGPGFNPDQARAWLAEAGYPEGKNFPRLSILYNSSQAHASIAVEIQAMWKRELGITIDLQAQEWATYLKAMDSLDYDIARSSWVGDYLDANTFLDCFVTGRGNNRTGWSHPDYDQLLAQANLQTDPQQRLQLMARAESILIQEQSPIAPIYFYVGMLCFDANRIGGIEGNLMDDHPMREWFLKKKQP
ncbi:MAG: peptide ABC transporter substrate-binding protein [Blastochloris sp.]|nr:peptide ABC transporter substrate-binding protein [Blastochloris sp.]